MGNQKNKIENVDRYRRRFLSAILIGGGAFLTTKVLGPLLSFFNEPSTRGNFSDKPSFDSFKIVEDKKVLSIYDSSGEEILQIDKEA
ncbi:MAG: hypothetical protein A2941_02730 [Candidatus Yanofskybacteria bacterium RIFCSPLOWO2_01_FULL_49_17]|uniref:Uncharacterized protein n=1 Tax=Candidatus Yanofskybacteria bacterium RIFCSPLOWO2_01_FULL_49_17 TaxID=1802700 RepID=A0A1F8GQU2_9BACT|nr:MAG: hypothetical protein A2941_02730 [Candidatus Yanofskybacteria bacterium RIFCSPLOWO2_01_FULL_49_17]